MSLFLARQKPRGISLLGYHPPVVFELGSELYLGQGSTDAESFLRICKIRPSNHEGTCRTSFDGSAIGKGKRSCGSLNRCTTSYPYFR